MCTFRGEKRRKRKEKEGEKREGKECARHLPGRITRFRCCVRMGGTGRGSFVVFTEILPLLLYLSAFYSLFFFRYIKYKGGGGFVAKGAIVRSFDSVGEDGTNLTLNFCLRMRPLMRILMCMWKGEKLWKSDGSLSNEITRR